MSRFDCDDCPSARRANLGCIRDGDTRFAKTEFETKRCPRRNVIEESDISTPLTLWRLCEGKAGIDALDKFSPHVIESFNVIERGRCAKMEADAALRRAQQESQSPRRGQR